MPFKHAQSCACLHNVVTGYWERNNTGGPRKSLIRRHWVSFLSHWTNVLDMICHWQSILVLSLCKQLNTSFSPQFLGNNLLHPQPAIILRPFSSEMLFINGISDYTLRYNGSGIHTPSSQMNLKAANSSHSSGWEVPALPYLRETYQKKTVWLAFWFQKTLNKISQRQRERLWVDRSEPK